jgi:hypothetical protein
MSGETRNRTGDAIIFSGVLRVRNRSWLFRFSCKSTEILRMMFLVVRLCLWRVGVRYIRE